MSERAIHFICGLPRSGSTLLCNLLGQNPAVHTTPTSACHEALFCIRNNWGNWIEHRAAPDLARRDNEQRVLSAMLHSYHDTDKPVIVDKGRGWTSLMEMTEFALGRRAKVVVPVRSIPQILASLEKCWRKASDAGQPAMGYFGSQTVDGRVQHWLKGDQVLGLAYNRLKDAIQRGFGDRLLVVEFDDLTHDPAGTMEGIGKFLGLSPHDYDFGNVQQLTHEDDSVHGMDLHTIRPEVRPIKDDSVSVLGADIVRKYTGTEFWRK